MATVAVEICPLDDVLDLPLDDVLDLGDLDRDTASVESVSALNALPMECSAKESEPQCQEFIGSVAPVPSATHHVCEWATTWLRLPLENLQEQWLCLPVQVISDAVASPREESKGFVDDKSIGVTNQLRLMALNKYLAALPCLSQHELFSSTNKRLHRLITANSGRVINVLQGEIAHATPHQADVLVSDDATTCHILALRSICCASKNKLQHGVLASLTHIDGTGYESCIRDAIMEHVKYHSNSLGYDQRGNSMLEECKENVTSTLEQHHVEISLHIMGGFNDGDGSSIEITEDVLQVLSRLAHELAVNASEGRPQVSMTLETCVVSGANDDGTCCPKGRGLGIEVASGKVFLAEMEENRVASTSIANDIRMELIAIDGDLHLIRGKGDDMQPSMPLAEGPDVVLRSVRLWAGAFYPSENALQKRKLSIIHCPDRDCLTIQPFVFSPHPYVKYLLRMNDTNLLQTTSTSPLVEKENFTSKVRESLGYMNGTLSSNVFGSVDGVWQPLEYRRVGLNGWVRCK